MPSLEERAEELAWDVAIHATGRYPKRNSYGLKTGTALILKALRDAQAEALEEAAKRVEAESPHTNWDPVAKQLRTRAATLRTLGVE